MSTGPKAAVTQAVDLPSINRPQRPNLRLQLGPFMVPVRAEFGCKVVGVVQDWLHLFLGDCELVAQFSEPLLALGDLATCTCPDGGGLVGEVQRVKQARRVDRDGSEQIAPATILSTCSTA